MNSQISLIIPTYNVEEFIQESLESVDNQTLSPAQFETIILDDASTDKTPEIIEKCIKGMKNTRFYCQEKNQGCGTARNQAIKHANSDLIVLLDGDDLLEPTALESTLGFMKSNPNVQYSYSMHKRIDRDGNFICNRPGYSYELQKLLHFNFIGPIQCFDKNLHNQIGGYEPENAVEDWDHVLRASEILEAGQIAQNPEYLYLYRVHGNNVTITNIQKLRESAVKMLNNSLKRRGINAKARFSQMTPDKYSYYEWEENESLNNTK